MTIDLPEGLSFNEAILVAERALLEAALEAANGNRSEAIRLLKMPRQSFYNKLDQHGLKPGETR